MRKAMILAAGLLLAGTMTGCGKGGGDDPSVFTAQGASANPSASASFDPVVLAKCMHDHGMDWFPEINGTDPHVDVPDGVDRDKLNAAVEACRKYAPPGAADNDAHGVSAADKEKALANAKCMRDNGVPDFPDPIFDETGIHLRGSGLDRDSTAYKAADEKCRGLLPTQGKDDDN